MPGFVGNALEPFLGVLGDTRHRRALLLAGGAVFAASAALTAVATDFWTLLIALAIGNPATTAFVSFAQASLMDLDAQRRERNMAWWTLAGSVGVVGGPVVLGLAVLAGGTWRTVSLGLALAALALTVAARFAPIHGGSDGEPFRRRLRGALTALRRREVVRWLALLEASDLMLDVLHGFLALYFVDVAGEDPVAAGLAVGVWTGAGLVGDALLIPLLARVRGTTYLRWSAIAVVAVYPAFLVVPRADAKIALLAVLGLLNSGWYAIPKAGLYAALPGRSGTAIAVGSVSGFAGALVPLAVGLAAEQLGLGPTMWLLLLAPIGLIVGLPRR